VAMECCVCPVPSLAAEEIVKEAEIKYSNRIIPCKTLPFRAKCGMLLRMEMEPLPEAAGARAR